MPRIELIERYIDAVRKLQSAIEIADSNSIEIHDKLVAMLFESILDFVPSDQQESIELASFLLNFIHPQNTESPATKGAKDKILRLLDQNALPPSTSTEEACLLLTNNV